MAATNSMPVGSQVSQYADPFIPVVMFFGVPPAASTVKMSPLAMPSSLMMPPMKATCLASGDHRGTAIWVLGLRIEWLSPHEASTVNNSAIYQLSSPSPCAAVVMNRLPSGDQSYSYTYRSAGDSWWTSPVATLTVVRRCSKNLSSTTPTSGVRGWSGPEARGAFSVNRIATVWPSGDHWGVARYPLSFVSWRAAPPPAGPA